MDQQNIQIENLLDLKIHNVIKVQNGVQSIRVPGGWIYYSQTTVNSNLVQTFVPEPFQLNYSDRILKEKRVDLISKVIDLLFLIILGVVTYLLIK